LLMAFANDLEAVFAVRLLLGLTSGSFPVGESYIAATTEDKNKRASLIASCGTFYALAFIVGPGIGTAVAQTQLGNSGPFVLGALLAYSCAAGSFRFISNDAGYSIRLHVADTSTKEDSADSASRSKLKIMCVMLASFMCGILGDMETVMLALGPLASMGLGQGAFSISMMVMAVIAAVFQSVFFDKVQRAVGVYRTGGLGSVLFVLCSAAWASVGAISCALTFTECEEFRLSAHAQEPNAVRGQWTSAVSAMDMALYSLGLVTFIVGYIMSRSVITPILYDAAPHAHRGFTVGLGATVLSAGRVAGPLILGSLLTSTTPLLAWLFAACSAAVMTICYVVAACLGDAGSHNLL